MLFLLKFALLWYFRIILKSDQPQYDPIFRLNFFDNILARNEPIKACYQHVASRVSPNELFESKFFGVQNFGSKHDLYSVLLMSLLINIGCFTIKCPMDNRKCHVIHLLRRITLKYRKTNLFYENFCYNEIDTSLYLKKF